MFTDGIGNGPEGHEDLGKCSQLACFIRSDFWDESEAGNPAPMPVSTTDDATTAAGPPSSTPPMYETIYNYQLIHKYEYAFDVELRSNERIILDEAQYFFNRHLYQYDMYFDDGGNVYKFPLDDVFLMNNAALNIDELRSLLRIDGYKIDEQDVVVIPPPEQETSGDEEYDDYEFEETGDNHDGQEIRTNVYVEEECW